MYNESGLVICQVCKKSFHFITANHLNKHNMTVKEYRKQYPKSPLFKKGYYDIPRNSKKKLKQNQNIPNIPIIEELSGGKHSSDFGTDDDVLTELSKIKLKSNSGPKCLDPMEEKLNIIGYLKNRFFGIKNNYMVVKRFNKNVEYELITDMADPVNKVVFEFPLSFWHNCQVGVSDEFKQQKLRADGWRVIVINLTMPRVKSVVKELEKRKI